MKQAQKSSSLFSLAHFWQFETNKETLHWHIKLSFLNGIFNKFPIKYTILLQVKTNKSWLSWTDLENVLKRE